MTDLAGTPQPKYKLADASIYSGESGKDTYYPGVAVEVGFSDLMSKSPRNAALWIDYTNLEALSQTSIADN